MNKKLLPLDTTIYFLPFIVISFWYLLNNNSRSRFILRDASFTLLSKYKVIIFIFVLVIFIVAAISINVLVMRMKQMNLIYNMKFIFVITYVLFVLIPIVFDAIFNQHIFQLINKLFRVSYISPIFADLNTILTGIDCDSVRNIGDKIYCDTKNDVIWNYPTFLLHLRFLAINSKLTFLIGILMTLIFAFVLTMFVNLNTIQKTFLMFLSFSPPLLLVVNRGNFDLIILCCLAIVGILLNKNQKYALEYSYLLIFTAAILKFYAIFTLPLLLLLNKKMKNYLYFIVTSAIFLLVSYKDIWVLSKYIGRDMSGSVGLSVFISHLNGNLNSDLSLFTIGGILFVIIFLYYLYFFNTKLSNIQIENYNNFIFIILSFAFTCTWFLSSNYYYRLVLLIFVIPFYFHHKSSNIENYLGITCFLSFYFSYRTFGLILNIALIPIIVFNILILQKLLRKKSIYD
jgi:hypothetical protein